MIVGFSGKAGSGKSTAAAYLREQHGFKLVKFATPMKNMLRSFLRDRGVGLATIEAMIEGGLKEVPTEHFGGKSCRTAMQLLGTEWGRKGLNDDLWTENWKWRARQFLRHGNKVIVDDVRFENEAEAVRALGGKVYELLRGNGIAGDHESESGIVPDEFIPNALGLAELHVKLDLLVLG